ncbi:mannitol dehydrogenase family protein [Cypionkella sp.]|uniref:mannitol dehydrogenase family protein n=1 Tax=Cypionkella sp. TaxID=2811411 RepID=UPI002AB94124|nr:mannitol dehydrogenase family protein [Cypionkella sp.]MDZ4392750.1 mannitol dehydrogenase family protein [Cypionkella sp.]
MSVIQSATPILQFGTSRFLQAHADLFLSETLAQGQALGPVTVVQSSGDAGRRGRLLALALPAGFVVRVQGLENGQPVSFETRVTSIRRALTTAEDWPEVCRIAAQEAEIILSNTSDAGFAAQPADHAPDFDQAMSYPAKLTQLLRTRWQAGGRPLQVMPTELIARNGDTLRNRVLDVAKPLDPGFADWVVAEVCFVSPLVDRIVSAPLEPAGVVAEPYALWAIEACPGLVLPCHHPAVQVAADLDRIEMLKLHILNLGHTWLVADWQARGGSETYVRELMANPAIRARLEALYTTEVLPGFAVHGIAEAPAYVAATLDRFANPYLDRRLADIAQNHAEKIRRRIGAFLTWSGVKAPQLRALAQAVPDANPDPSD